VRMRWRCLSFIVGSGGEEPVIVNYKTNFIYVLMINIKLTVLKISFEDDK
jgi:hypothetical protein